MDYFQEQPDEELRKYVRCYWVFENNSTEEVRHTIMPDGFFDVLIYFHDNELVEIIQTGLWTEKTEVAIKPKTQILGIQFRLLAVDNIFQGNIAPLLNRFEVAKNDFWGLDDFIGSSVPEVLAFVKNHLLSIVDNLEKSNPRRDKLLNLIDQSTGNNTVDFYSKEAGWSPRQINRYFQSTFGLSLKSYCTIRKGASSYSQIKRGHLFPKNNYFDQSHFIKEIKRITGATPKELNKNENDRFLQFSIIEED